MAFVIYVAYVLLLVSAAKAGFLDPTKEDILKKKLDVQQDCSLQYNVPQTYLKLLLEGGAYESKNGKCFMKCGLVGMGYINGDGSLNRINLRSTVENYFNDEQQQEFVINSWETCDQKCHSEFYTDDSCDRAFNLAKCFIRQIKNSGLLPKNVLKAI